jgi:hypothetical protein
MQGSQMNVKMSLTLKKKSVILNQGLHQKNKISALRHGKKKPNAGALQRQLQKLSVIASSITK